MGNPAAALYDRSMSRLDYRPYLPSPAQSKIAGPTARAAKFHVHTIVRTPNGNDYGMDLLRLHYEQAPHHHKR